MVAGVALVGAVGLVLAGCTDDAKHGKPAQGDGGKVATATPAPSGSASPSEDGAGMNGGGDLQAEAMKAVHGVKLTTYTDDDGLRWVVVDYAVTNRGSVPASWDMTFALYGPDQTERLGVLECTAEQVQPGETVRSDPDGCATDTDAYNAPRDIEKVKYVKLISAITTAP